MGKQSPQGHCRREHAWPKQGTCGQKKATRVQTTSKHEIWPLTHHLRNLRVTPKINPRSFFSYEAQERSKGSKRVPHHENQCDISGRGRNMAMEGFKTTKIYHLQKKLLTKTTANKNMPETCFDMHGNEIRKQHGSRNARTP